MKRRPRRNRFLSLADVEGFSVDQGLWRDASGLDSGTAARVRMAVREALTPKQRAVVEAYFFEGLSQSEIARRLSISQQVVQKTIFGAPRAGRIVGGALSRLRVALSSGS